MLNKRQHDKAKRLARKGKSLPRVRNSNKVIAIVCSDIHLSHRPPVARSAEPNWYAAMARPLAEIQNLMIEHDCPLFVAGDIFHQWDSPPELINFAIENLPLCYAIPGNHDLPNHNLDEIKRSAYWTLVKAKRVTNLKWGRPLTIRNIRFHPYPWGRRVSGLGEDYTESPICFNVALIHDYCWSHGTGHGKAEQINNIGAWQSRLAGYDLAVFGDNHHGFQNGKVFNCGGLMRRRFDEHAYTPQIGLVGENGVIQPYQLDCTEDKFSVQDEKMDMEGVDMEDLFDELLQAGDKSLDFVQALQNVLRKRKVDPSISEIIDNSLASF